MGTLEWSATAGGAAVTLFTIVAFAWGFFRWVHRPHLLCGIVPLEDERRDKSIADDEVGRPSPLEGLEPRAGCLALRVDGVRARLRSRRDPQRIQELFSHQRRCRVVATGGDGAASLPVLLANTGGRVACDYWASVAFSARGVHLVDVLTETLEISCVYVERRDLLGPNARQLAVSGEIVAVYRDIARHVRPWGDALFLSGNLESGMYEIALIQIMIEDDVEQFYVVYTLDTSDGWLGATEYVQPCVVDRQLAA